MLEPWISIRKYRLLISCKYCYFDPYPPTKGLIFSLNLPVHSPGNSNLASYIPLKSGFLPVWCAWNVKLLTNQDLTLAGKTLVTVLMLMEVNRNSIEIRQLFSQLMALNLSGCKKWKIWNILCLKLPIWHQKWVTSVQQLTCHLSNVARQGNSWVIIFQQNVLFLVKLNPAFSS